GRPPGPVRHPRAVPAGGPGPWPGTATPAGGAGDIARSRTVAPLPLWLDSREPPGHVLSPLSACPLLGATAGLPTQSADGGGGVRLAWVPRHGCFWAKGAYCTQVPPS